MLVYGISKKMGNSGALNLPPPESVESGDGSPAREWVLVGMAESSVLGKPEHGNHSYLYIVKNSLTVLHVTDIFSLLTWSEMTMQTTVLT